MWPEAHCHARDFRAFLNMDVALVSPLHQSYTHGGLWPKQLHPGYRTIKRTGNLCVMSWNSLEEKSASWDCGRFFASSFQKEIKQDVPCGVRSQSEVCHEKFVELPFHTACPSWWRTASSSHWTSTDRRSHEATHNPLPNRSARLFCTLPPFHQIGRWVCWQEAPALHSGTLAAG